MILKNIGSLSDEEFEKIIVGHDEAISNYIESILYDFVAYYIASGYNLSAISDSSLISHVNSAIESLAAIQFKDKFDYNKLRNILLDKYKLKIVNEERLNIIEIKND